ncbi:MAG: hypothetical protein H6642_01185 [Caldilineaceae bacterium]|nr:hypothetical protein [Caldilineaceae bacterium]MCB9136942.1 hypothetical protein [Caldilineaceae bacterium]
MAQSKLRQVLTLFEESNGSLSLPQMARRLDVSQSRLEEMIQYWVRKGKIRASVSLSDCGTCGHGDGGCPFTMELPKGYELAGSQDGTGFIPLQALGGSCAHKEPK